MLPVSSCDRNNRPECDYIAIASDVHTAFQHADIDQELFAEQQSQSCVKMKFGNSTMHRTDVAKHRNCGTNMLCLFGKPALQPTPDKSYLLQKC